ncbi:maleylpyruvate isomerase family mycothiol-dependent enzyme [Streptomyces sp. NBC_00503]|uniref:maleylpyruvate isomerase family mycothiol-dependent enzyme n=1 Tax=Streptomyces sp. NBC_00503 TaxID=2903659 RepID=UPI002E820340|nr:maleylpyruvate isomerase family mycothiol-dependent enzyme [Streptomyces sp. NBC_00503]WUD80724.1 maleylpyruvate isomerase family mycothiol-dependent enzyme [Streptomyces sp. NBC_00503]
MTDHVHDLQSVREATDRLLTAAAKLDNAALAEESHLPGWSRGHILAHLARNADALVNVFEGRPMYESGTARDADIERDSGRPLLEQLEDVRNSAAAWQAVAEAPQDWTRTLELRNGVTDSASRIPFRRLVEVELHHVDLNIGYELADLPDRFTGQEIEFLAERWSGHPDVPATALAATDGRHWRTGSAGEPAVTVTGSAAALLAWLSGRADKGASLTTEGGQLPALPPL